MEMPTLRRMLSVDPWCSNETKHLFIPPEPCYLPLKWVRSCHLGSFPRHVSQHLKTNRSSTLSEYTRFRI